LEKLRPNSDIEILRALAILMVLVQHFPSLYFWSDHAFFISVNKYISFWSGVDLFLCISGFVVGCSLIGIIDAASGDRSKTRKTILAFFTKRAFRLLPTSIFWVSLIIILTYTYNVSGAFGDKRWNIYQAASVLTYNYNILSHYMLINRLPATLGPYWSLNLEEQFYFALPLFMIFIKNLRITALLLFIAIQFFITRQDTYLFNFRLDALCWGVILSLLFIRGRLSGFEPSFMRKKWISAAITTILLVLLMVTIALLNNSPFMVGSIAIISMLLVYIASFNKRYIFMPDFIRKIMLYIGSRSYAIYLIHMPAIYFIQESVIRYYIHIGRAPSGSIELSMLMTACAILLTLFISEINYRVIESPLRKLGRKYAERISE
jgi:peptidoglycan/LPS O-acetylase OafA/YrhL